MYLNFVLLNNSDLFYYVSDKYKRISIKASLLDYYHGRNIDAVVSRILFWTEDRLTPITVIIRQDYFSENQNRFIYFYIQLFAFVQKNPNPEFKTVVVNSDKLELLKLLAKRYHHKMTINVDNIKYHKRNTHDLLKKFGK